MTSGMQTRIDSLGIKPTVVEEIAEGYEISRPMVAVTTRRDNIYLCEPSARNNVERSDAGLSEQSQLDTTVNQSGTRL